MGLKRIVILERLALPELYSYSIDGKPAIYSGPVEPQPKLCKRSLQMTVQDSKDPNSPEPSAYKKE